MIDAKVTNPLILPELGLDTEVQHPLGCLLGIPHLQRLHFLFLDLAILPRLLKCVPVIHYYLF